MTLAKAIRAVLADGEWHHREEIVSAVDHCVRPEVAARFFTRKGSRLGIGEDLDRCVRVGKSEYIRNELLGLVRKGKLQRNMDEYRLP